MADQTPDLAGFAAAQDRKRKLIGSDVKFLWPMEVTFPPDTPTSPETGLPLDPTVSPLSSAQSSAIVRAGVFFKAINRGGAANAEVSTAIGRDEKSRLFLSIAWADRETIAGAEEFVFHEDHYQIVVVKNDEIVRGYRRVLVYGAAKGSSQ